MTTAREPVPLLWTSGWDSTFQLFRLLMQERVAVQPIYLIDQTRRSTAAERQAMQRIIGWLRGHDAAAAARMAPTREQAVSALVPDERIDSAFARLRQQHGLGGQYPWLARFVERERLDGLHLSIDHGSRAHRVLEPWLVACSSESLEGFRIDPVHRGSDIFTVFGAFAMPLMAHTKARMAQEAQQQGWIEGLKLTWFCHKPRLGMTPCGVCNPCQAVIRGGLAWRLPWLPRTLGQLKLARSRRGTAAATAA
jgi:hypothetical protein